MLIRSFKSVTLDIGSTLAFSLVCLMLLPVIIINTLLLEVLMQSAQPQSSIAPQDVITRLL